METTPLQQIVNLIKNKDRILLITHRKIDGDALGGLMALYLILKSIGKEVTAASSDPLPEIFHFLPKLDQINTDFRGMQDFIITLDCAQTEVDKLKYTLEDNKVNIIVTPLKGAFSEKDISFAKGGSHYDLIIVLDSADLEQIGNIYEQNTDLFYSAPVINIDHHASNTFFGNLNLVEITAASTTEILYALIKKMEQVEGRKLLTEEIATLLLMGIITDTGSFQNPNTTPKSFGIAADLIDLGARQQEIIQHIYKTKKVSTLRLWGQTLSKIQIDPIHRLVWSAINKNDFAETESTPDESAGIIDELMSNAPGAEIILLVKDNLNGTIGGSLRTTSVSIDASKIAQLFGGGGHLQAAGFKIKNGQDFDLILAEILQKIRAYQAKRLHLPEQYLPSEEKEANTRQEEREIPLEKKEENISAKIEFQSQPSSQGAALPSKITELDFLTAEKTKPEAAPKTIEIDQKLTLIPSSPISQEEATPQPQIAPDEKQIKQEPSSTEKSSAQEITHLKIKPANDV